jgi:hypothetical protein
MLGNSSCNSDAKTPRKLFSIFPIEPTTYSPLPFTQGQQLERELAVRERIL